jgi:hypothetical protein
MINAFDLTAGTSLPLFSISASIVRALLTVLFLLIFIAFTYDAATQNDGMHIIGGPMKMLATKLLHHVCQDAVEGSPV